MGDIISLSSFDAYTNVRPYGQSMQTREQTAAYKTIRHTLIRTGLKPGTPISAKALADDLGWIDKAEVTDHLTYLAKQGLIDAGLGSFCTKILQRGEVYDLYRQNDVLLAAALLTIEPGQQGDDDTLEALEGQIGLADRTAELFNRIAMLSQIEDLARRIDLLNDRLQWFREQEPKWLGADRIANELNDLQQLYASRNWVLLQEALSKYHDRRIDNLAGSIGKV